MIAPLILCATIISVTASEPLSYWEMVVSGEHIIRVTSEVPVTRVDLTMTDLAGNVGTAGWTAKPKPLPTPVEVTPTPEPLMYHDGYGTWYGIAPVRLPATTYAISYLPDCSTPQAVRYYAGGNDWREHDWRFSRVWVNEFPQTVLFDATGLEGSFLLGNSITCATGELAWNLRALQPEFYLEYPNPTYEFTRIPTERSTPTWTQTCTMKPVASPTNTLKEPIKPTPTVSPPATITPSASATPRPTWTPYIVRLRLRAVEYKDGWMELILEPRRPE